MKRENLNFSNPAFGTFLYQHLMENLEEINLLDKSFLFDFSRLVFRWLVHLKQQKASKFKTWQILFAVKNLTSFIHESGDTSFPSNLKFAKMNDVTFERFIDLVNYELEGGDSQLLLKYSMIINGFYNEEIEEIDNDIITLLLDSNYDNNLLLRYSLVINDPFGNIRSQYFGELEETSRFQNYKISSKSINKFLKDESLVDEYENLDISFLDVKDNLSPDSPTESKRID